MKDTRRSEMALDAVKGHRQKPAETVQGDRDTTTTYGEMTSKPNPRELLTPPEPGYQR
jgi:hypothetical protein